MSTLQSVWTTQCCIMYMAHIPVPVCFFLSGPVASSVEVLPVLCSLSADQPEPGRGLSPRNLTSGEVKAETTITRYVCIKVNAIYTATKVYVQTCCITSTWAYFISHLSQFALQSLLFLQRLSKFTFHFSNLQIKQ